VVVENVSSGTTAVFPAGKGGAPGGRWFASDDDDNKCRRLLTARTTSEFVYTVTVFTSDVKVPRRATPRRPRAWRAL
jgi:hypothetical protein